MAEDQFIVDCVVRESDNTKFISVKDVILMLYADKCHQTPYTQEYIQSFIERLNGLTSVKDG